MLPTKCIYSVFCANGETQYSGLHFTTGEFLRLNLLRKFLFSKGWW